MAVNAANSLMTQNTIDWRGLRDARVTEWIALIENTHLQFIRSARCHHSQHVFDPAFKRNAGNGRGDSSDSTSRPMSETQIGGLAEREVTDSSNVKVKIGAWGENVDVDFTITNVEKQISTTGGFQIPNGSPGWSEYSITFARSNVLDAGVPELLEYDISVAPNNSGSDGVIQQIASVEVEIATSNIPTAL